jgi:fluoroquinolone transport system permease protein
MVVLSEADDSIARSLFVSPAGKTGYIISRLVFPAFISYGADIMLLLVFSLTSPDVVFLLFIPLVSCLLAITVSMLVITYAGNRVEGMALEKLSGALMLGLFIPFFVSGPAQYLFSILPSFWLARFILARSDPGQSVLCAIAAVLTGAAWLAVLARRYLRRFV